MNRTLASWILAALAAAFLASTSLAGAEGSGNAAKAKRDDWPDTPAGTMARTWVNAFRKGEKAMRACLEQNLAPESLAERGIPARLESYRTLHEKLGDLMLVRVVASATDSVTATLATSEMSEREFTFRVQPRPPHKLLRVSFLDTRQVPHGGHGGHGGGSPH